MRITAPIDLWQRNERLRFLVIGAWNTLFGYLAYVALYALLNDKVHYLVIGLAAHAIGMVNAFACHRLLVFRSRGGLVADFVRFNVSQLVVAGLGLIALWCLVDGLGMTPLPAQALVVAIAVVLSYLAHRYFTFAT